MPYIHNIRSVYLSPQAILKRCPGPQCPARLTLLTNPLQTLPRLGLSRTRHHGDDVSEQGQAIKDCIVASIRTVNVRVALKVLCRKRTHQKQRGSKYGGNIETTAHATIDTPRFNVTSPAVEGNPVDVPQGIDQGAIRPDPSLLYTVPSRLVPLLRPNQISPVHIFPSFPRRAARRPGGQIGRAGQRREAEEAQRRQDG